MKQKSSRWLDLILCAVLVGLSHPAVAGSEAGFRSLLEGNELGGWDGDKRLWSIKDGVITGRTTADPPLKANTFLIWREGIVDDFELHFSYRILGGNSGVQYRSKDLGNWSVGGYQADLEAGQTYSGAIKRTWRPARHTLESSTKKRAAAYWLSAGSRPLSMRRAR